MAGDDYAPKQPKDIYLFPQVISSEAFEHFLEGLIPLVLECTESGGGNLVQFKRDKNGQFFMLFQNHRGEFRAIVSRNPHWIAKVKAALAEVSAEKDLSDSLSPTDF